MKIIKIHNNKKSIIIDKSLKLFFEPTPIDLYDNFSLFIINESELNITASLEKDNNIKLYKTDNENLITEYQSLTEFKYKFENNLHIYQINLLFKSQENAENVLTISIGSEIYTFELYGESIELNEKLIELCQNFKFTLSDDYITAFKENDSDEEIQNIELLNNKRKEYLISIYEQTGFIGTYKSLYSALDYFGWNDLLSIREIWKNNNEKYTTTTITNEIQDFKDNRLSGFVKTGQLQLIYQINKYDGTITDELENYVNVLWNVDDVLLKLYTLKRILETDFLTNNTKIIDVIGEHTTPSQVTNKVWLNEVEVVNMNLNSKHTIEITLDKSDILFSNHRSILKEPHRIGDPILQYKAGEDSSVFNDEYFEIESYDDNIPTFQNSDYVTKYHRGDYGIITYNLNAQFLLIDHYFAYSFELKNENNNVVFNSAKTDIQQLKSKIHIGVRNLGKFTGSLYLYERYGGVDIYNINEQAVIRNQALDFKILKYSYDTKDISNLNLASSYPSSTGTKVVDIIDSTYDINLDSSTKTELYKLAESKHNEFNCNIHSLKGIPISEYKNLPISNHGYSYLNIVIDILGISKLIGNRKLKTKYFSTDNFVEIEKTFTTNDINNEIIWLTDFIKLMKQKTFFNDFIIYIDYIAFQNVNEKYPIIRMISKNAGWLKNDITIECESPNNGNKIYTKNERFIVEFSSRIRIPIINLGSNGSLELNGVTYPNIIFSSLEAIKTYLNDKNISTIIDNSTNTILLMSDENISIKHTTFGDNLYESKVFGNINNKLQYVEYGEKYINSECFFAFPNFDIKNDSKDYTWTLKDSLTNNIIDTQKGYMYINRLFDKKTYDLELTSTDKFETLTKVRKGVVRVENS